MNIAKVVVDVPASQTDRVYDYLIPAKLMDVLQPGMRVIVPFGNRRIMGFVLQISNSTEVDKLKEIQETMDLLPALTPELLDLGVWMGERTLSFHITALQAMLPQAMKATYKKILVKTGDIPVELQSVFSKDNTALFEQFEQSGVSFAILQQAIKAGQVELRYQVNSKETKKTVRMLDTKKTVDELQEELSKVNPRAMKQKALLEHFIEEPGPVAQKQLLSIYQTTASTLKPLLDADILQAYDKEIMRDPYEDRKIEPTTPLELSDSQAQALQPILESISTEKHDVFLLHGVTGSGKTEVYLQAIQQVLDKGQEAIVLVPEIALTPQTVNRFKGRFGSDVAVLHSALSAGEKYDEWRKIQRKTVKVAVGARSAIFAPFENLGIIIIDEEHETSYKQEDHPKYHARDIAIFRGKYHHAPIVLGSATPSLESYARAEKGVYQMLELPERVNDASMPDYQIIDMRDELHAGNRSIFSRELLDQMKERIRKKEQTVLFLNRRGYSTFVMCRDCGHTVECPHCDITLTYHRSSEQLKCHYCGYEEPVPHFCPSCESDTIRYFGTGTQKVEETLTQLLPEARVIRMDVDTTRRKGSHEKLLGAFGRGEADILLGTQMIAKGLDFERVTLVGVLAADSMLHLPDFRAAEKTFQLLTQVSGRAGRHTLPGEVIIQTYSPEHYSVELAASGDYRPFFQTEMQTRRVFQYPPYYYLALLTISHQNQVKAMQTTQTIVQLLQKHLSDQVRILGPTPSPLARIKDRYRFQCMIKYKNEPNLRDVIRRILHYYEDARKKEDLQIHVDLQPYSLM
ncbi:primosomal protein N' [Terribacillus sp. DMT04]|uniref:primosomal protein N' n=1 Tax=Terribacillus sp. DMT04 TaxID=2850441 RepID=UPI001C2C4CE2|nr:primosomal protein N' [Terribacillus sp. DMT04]QXE03049.1 primosomal protein N' [Terribacillus sp. DMT04]